MTDLTDREKQILRWCVQASEESNGMPNFDWEEIHIIWSKIGGELYLGYRGHVHDHDPNPIDEATRNDSIWRSHQEEKYQAACRMADERLKKLNLPEEEIIRLSWEDKTKYRLAPEAPHWPQDGQKS